MALRVPPRDSPQTSTRARWLLLALAAVRGVIAGLALLLAPFLYEEHAAVLVLLRPTKEVFLFAGFLMRRGDLALPPVLLAAPPLLLGGVWVFYALGRAYAPDMDHADLPGLAGRLLPRSRIERLREVLEDRGMPVVFIGRLAAFPSSLMAAAAGSSEVGWASFLLADAAGGLVSMTTALSLGYVLGEAYESAGPWLTAVGVAALVGLAVLVGRALTSSRSSRSSRTSSPSSS
jgi:membrane-associated protein